MLDAVLSPAWESRYFSFDSGWGPGEEMASMRNGSGDEYSIVFCEAGVFIRGFDHESRMSPAASEFGEPWPGVIDAVPEVFAHCVREPAFSFDGVPELTVCLWRQRGDDRWHAGEIEFPPGDDPDGAQHLFALLVDGSAEAYQRFAEDYYEVAVDLDAIGQVLALRPLGEALVQQLNPQLSAEDLAEDLATIGYPAVA
ncbi:hypothetical protein GCM10007977_107670 [Dactylosporangium sucinum]|uniref:Uncharacterized protein n=2 Tax=Dactylosporangium sucinum TaxID=1424081 RepID=A0A917UF05_9ACTN|nr:hypothetical protein GCM10007977_107670 [Dactylosporangium sucinum]